MAWLAGGWILIDIAGHDFFRREFSFKNLSPALAIQGRYFLAN
jgi:hypothetical protein